MKGLETFIGDFDGADDFAIIFRQLLNECKSNEKKVSFS
jgi:hypothetical protein